MQKKGKDNKPLYISKEFVRGTIVDSQTPKSIMMIFGGMILLMLAFLLLGMMMLVDQALIRTILNGALIFLCYLIFYSTGAGNGTSAVNQGEILQKRIETDRPITDREKALCYHPLKGLLIGMTATIPFVIIAVVFACITTRQMTTQGALPSWVSSISGHEEVTAPLGYYMTTTGLQLEEVLRIIVRCLVMPYVNIFDSSNMDSMLLLERIAPVFILLPGLFYGLGYMQGPRRRARVHGDIALGKKKQARKARRDHKRRVMAREPRKPEQLN